MRMKRCLACTWMAVFLWIGCGESRAPSPFPNRDAARRDSQVELDGGHDFDASIELDGGHDSDADMSFDGGVDIDADAAFDGRTSDVFEFDSGAHETEPDAASGVDASSEDECLDEHGGFDFCRCDPPHGEDCSVTSCRTGFVCVADGCGMHCKLKGRTCSTADDCPSGSVCSEGERVCRRDEGCSDSRDCPSGFACEAGECQNRRVRCGIEAPCPNGFVCDHSQGGLPFCVRAITRCATDAGCLFGMLCRDVDGDGLSECVARGTCNTNLDCASRLTCETMPVEIFAACGNHGACRNDSDCPSDARCTDLWGDGVRTCAPVGGQCNHTTDCTSPQICAVPTDGSPPRCVGAAL